MIRYSTRFWGHTWVLVRKTPLAPKVNTPTK